MHLMIFYPGGVSQGFTFSEEPSNEELYDIMYTAATVEQGNGKKRKDIDHAVINEFHKGDKDNG